MVNRKLGLFGDKIALALIELIGEPHWWRAGQF